jgi:3-(3-hydroxy-phenyl)propionate hydroxylase
MRHRADVTPEVRERYLGDLNRAYYLIRPDQIIAGRWVDLDPDRVQSAIDDIWGKRP